jgi:hypothetical protein
MASPSQTINKNYIQSLGNAIDLPINALLMQLDFKSIINFCSTSKEYLSLLKDGRLWNMLLIRDIGKAASPEDISLAKTAYEVHQLLTMRLMKTGNPFKVTNDAKDPQNVAIKIYKCNNIEGLQKFVLFYVAEAFRQALLFQKPVNVFDNIKNYILGRSWKKIDLPFLEKIAVEFPKNPQKSVLLSTIGDYYIQGGQLDKAMDIVIKIPDSNPQKCSLLGDIFNLAIKSKNYDRAEEIAMLIPEGNDLLRKLYLQKVKEIREASASQIRAV